MSEVTKELDPRLDRAAMMLARGEKAKNVAEATGFSSAQTLYNYRHDNQQFHRKIEEYQQEIREETKRREQKLIEDMYDSSDSALKAIAGVLSQSGVICPECGKELNVCPNCGGEIKTCKADNRDVVQAARVIIDGLIRRRGDEESKGGGVPHLYLDLRKQTVNTGGGNGQD